MFLFSCPVYTIALSRRDRLTSTLILYNENRSVRLDASEVHQVFASCSTSMASLTSSFLPSSLHSRCMTRKFAKITNALKNQVLSTSLNKNVHTMIRVCNKFVPAITRFDRYTLHSGLYNKVQRVGWRRWKEQLTSGGEEAKGNQ